MAAFSAAQCTHDTRARHLRSAAALAVDVWQLHTIKVCIAFHPQINVFGYSNYTLFQLLFSVKLIAMMHFMSSAFLHHVLIPIATTRLNELADIAKCGHASIKEMFQDRISVCRCCCTAVLISPCRNVAVCRS